MMISSLVILLVVIASSLVCGSTVDDLKYHYDQRSSDYAKHHDQQVEDDPDNFFVEVENNNMIPSGAAIDNLEESVLINVAAEECDRCNNLKKDPVCGANGMTYTTVCHAKYCGRLKMKDILIGACEAKNPCSINSCSKDEVCIPNANGPCLFIYKPGGQKVPCQLYTCAPRGICATGTDALVCGENGRTYPNLCSLYTAKVNLAYTGACRPIDCIGDVCGRNGITYRSACHAKASSNRIDYVGKCFRESYTENSCDDVRRSNRCPKVSCSSSVIPEGSCCPVCGGSITLQLDLKKLAATSRDSKHFHHVKSFIRKHIPISAGEVCIFSTVLTERNVVSVVLEPKEPDKEEECVAASVEMLLLINKHISKMKTNRGTENIFTAAQLVKHENHKVNEDTTNEFSPNSNGALFISLSSSLIIAINLMHFVISLLLN